MPGINTYVEPLEQIDLTDTDSPQEVNLKKSVLMTALELRMEGAITLSGGSTSGTLLTETPHNIIEWVMCERDGIEFVKRIPGRMLAVLQRAMSASPPRFTTFADGSAATTNFSATYFIPFALPLIVNPFETVGYYPPVSDTYKLHVKRIATPGVSDFFTGNDRTFSLDSLTIQPYVHYARTPVSYRPKLLPRYEVADSDVIAASQDRFPMNVFTLPNERLAMVIQGALRDGVGVDDIITEVNFKTDRTNIFDRVPPARFVEQQNRFYPGIDASAGALEVSTSQAMPVGYYLYNFLSDAYAGRWGLGKIRQALDAQRNNGYQFQNNVTHTSGTEQLRNLLVNLESVPGWTSL